MSNMINTRALKGKLGDIRRSNNFRLLIKDITDAPGADIDLIVQRAFLPRVSLDVLDLRHGNDSVKLAGVATWSSGEVTVLDVLSTAELDVITGWFSKTYKHDKEVGGIIGMASEYKKQGTIYEYASDGTVERAWDVEGLWISELNLGDLDATRGDLKEISMTIQIDPSPLKPRYERDDLQSEESDDVISNPGFEDIIV